MASVGRAWNSAADDPTLWRRLAAQAFGENGGKLLFQQKAWTSANWLCAEPQTSVRCLRGGRHAGMVTALAVDGDIAASGGNDGVVMLWSTATNELLATLSGHTSAISALLIAGARVFSGSWDKSVRVWDVGSGQCIQHWVW